MINDSLLAESEPEDGLDPPMFVWDMLDRYDLWGRVESDYHHISVVLLADAAQALSRAAVEGEQDGMLGEELLERLTLAATMLADVRRAALFGHKRDATGEPDYDAVSDALDKAALS